LKGKHFENVFGAFVLRMFLALLCYDLRQCFGLFKKGKYFEVKREKRILHEIAAP
jgi:hypothetical protein